MDLYTFDSLLRILLARATKIAKNLLEVKIVAPIDVFLRITRLKLSVQIAVARATNAKLASFVY